MSKPYVWEGHKLISGAAALKILKERNPKRYATKVTSVRWEESYDINVEDKSYTVIRSRSTFWNAGHWHYNVLSMTNRERRHCDPDKPTHKRVVAELLKLIEV